ncbi:hypothetical protein HYDPIDRAFT_86875 [Hydnomerulius pinastri MD-312]|nr:hypothetical protein HYDPIDRAFT_86875 [Hydnomerulius pinastri MD-312]
MWIGHVAPALAAKPFAPGVPLSILALAGALPDATFFVLNFLGIESFRVDEGLMNRGCFPYATNYPYSHSLVGMAAAGVAFAVGYMLLSGRKVTAKDEAVLLAVTLSHFLIELPSHRPDIKITPGDTQNIGAGLFDHPAALFIVECALFLGGLGMYATFSPLATRVGYKRAGYMPRLWAVVAYFVVQQAHFCFGAAPTYETRWVHAPLFLFEILANSWLLGKLEA